MTVTSTYTLSFGLFTEGLEAITEDAWNLFLVEEVAPVFPNFSVRDELGFWQGEPEPVRVVTIISDEEDYNTATGIWGICKIYKERFKQEAVLVNSYTSFTDLI